MCPAGRECLGSACADLGLVSNSGKKEDMSGEEEGRKGRKDQEKGKGWGETEEPHGRKSRGGWTRWAEGRKNHFTELFL